MSQDAIKGVSEAFIANFVHQVVNPLNGVIGTLDNVHDGTYSEAVAKQKINASRAQLEQCVTLIRNLAYLTEYFSTEEPSKSIRSVRSSAVSILPQVVIEAMQFFQISAGAKYKA
jgi:signal transduction histidine kinase